MLCRARGGGNYKTITIGGMWVTPLPALLFFVFWDNYSRPLATYCKAQALAYSLGAFIF